MPHLEGVRHREVVVAGLRLHVAEAGPPDAPAVVLQHGWPQHWWAWRRILPALAAEHRVICPDLRGLGWSEGSPGGYEKEALAGDLLGVLDALELERVLLVGHDWGGFVGFLACLRRPERFSGLLALAISHPWPASQGVPNPLALLRLSYQVVLAAPGTGRALLSSRPVVRAFLARAGDGVWDEETLDLYATSLMSGPGVQATVGIYRSFLTGELLPLVRGRYADQRLEIPARLVVGQEDPVLSEDVVTGFEEHAPLMTAGRVPDAGHWLPEQMPETVLEEIARLE